MQEDDIKTESVIVKILLELQSRLDKAEIIAIIYNPTRDEGMKQDDNRFLITLFEHTKYNYPLIILSGHGGDFIPGIYFPHVIKSHVRDYKTYVPRICGSALCYTILKSRELFWGKNTTITQIDPMFIYDGYPHRAIKTMLDNKEINSDLKKMAKEVFQLADKHIRNLCSSPSLFKYELMESGGFQHADNLAALFMNKEHHEKEITLKELEALEANIKHIDDEADFLASELIQKCQDFTIRKNVRVVFVSSIPIKLHNEQEGSFICPLV